MRANRDLDNPDAILAPLLAVCRPLRPAGRRILEVLLASIGRTIEEAVCIGHAFDAARVGRIRVENVMLNAKENTEPVGLTLHGVGAVSRLQFGLAAVVVF